MEDEGEKPCEAVTSRFAELEDTREEVDIPPCEGMLHLDIERHERSEGDLCAWSRAFLARRRVTLFPTGTNDLRGVREPLPL